MPRQSRKSPSPTKARAATAGSSSDAALDPYWAKRDFERTAEPRGDTRVAKRAAAEAAKEGTLEFVIQKHAATRLHFDLRLELDGVMKSWAVPKGPSVDPTVKR